MDYSARWYSPNVGRFTSRDSWTGDTNLPQTLNRYAYTLNNPIKYNDPSGHMPCYEDANGDLHCGYSDNPDDWGVTVPNPPIVPAGPTEEQLRALKELDYNRLAGLNPANEDTSSPYDDYDYYDDAAGWKAAVRFFITDPINTLKDKSASKTEKVLAALSLNPFGNLESKAVSKTLKLVTHLINGEEYQLIGNNPLLKYSRGELTRINTDLPGGKSAAEEIFNNAAKGQTVHIDSNGYKYISDSNGNRIIQLRITEDGKVNLDVFINGVYEDIHFTD